MDATPSRSSLALRATALACVVALSLTGCGASGGESAATTSPTPAAADPPDTTEPDDDTFTSVDENDGEDAEAATTTPEGDDGPAGEVSLDDLEAILPDESIAGDDFRSNSDVEEGFDEADDLDQALAEACPQLIDLLDDVVSDGRVGRLFEGEGDQTLAVMLDPSPDSAWDEDRLDITLATAQGCSPLELDLGAFTTNVDLDLQRDDTYGDRGIDAYATVVIRSDELPGPVTYSVAFRAFVSGSVLVVTSSSDGLDEDTFDPIPADHDRLDTVAADLEDQLADLD